MHVGNYFLQGEVSHSGLPQWLAEQTGLYGNSPDAVALIIWINSNGGDVLAAIESINLIKASPIPVITVINGCAESAALLIAMSGHYRFALNNSWGMAHHFSTAMEGSYHDLMDSVKHNALLHKTMENLFKEHSKLSDNEIHEVALGRKTTWLSSDELVSSGLIDEVLEASSDLKKRIFAHATKKASKEEKTDLKKHVRRKDSAAASKLESTV